MRFTLFALLTVVTALPLIGQQGSLSVKANPGRAGVFLDGKYLGPAANFRVARTYAVPAGEHDLKLVEPRYEEYTQKVTIEPGKKTKVSVAMKALPRPQGPFGVLRTKHPDRFAAVYVNRKYFGHVDEFSNISQGIKLVPGDYEVRIEPLSGDPIETKVKIEANRTIMVK